MGAPALTEAPLKVTTRSAEETQAFGRRIGALLERGDLVLLHGTLGAGKTTLTQGIAWGAGVTKYAHSPTFVLVHEYGGRIPIYHLDLYRLDELLEVHDLGIEEMLEEGACVVEWAEKAPEVFPRDHLAIDVVPGVGDERTLNATPHGARYVRLVRDLREAPSR
ncbi:MAG: tRNA (adenosine(37)-N6)-threonylcarbamoyltransferase complex ATPase subunit type 1 TsaE [SAR202 cluster bacterium]|nr:tRNA (adenosine(37)-N6)-threonylcarbamoyltransferase complex ATPase subunit type 1 TsaE [SAR202 cluster bacterium]